MMNYDARLRWIRDRICMRNWGVMTPGRYCNEIVTSVKPTSEMVQLGNNWDIELYPEDGNGFIEIFEKSTEREFTIYINMK